MNMASRGMWPQRLSSPTVPHSAGSFSRKVYLSSADMSIDSREQSAYLRVHLNALKIDPFRVLCVRLVRYAPSFNIQGTDLPRIGVSPGAWEFGGTPSSCHSVHGPFVIQVPFRFLGGCYLKGCQGLYTFGGRLRLPLRFFHNHLLVLSLRIVTEVANSQ